MVTQASTTAVGSTQEGSGELAQSYWTLVLHVKAVQFGGENKSVTLDCPRQMPTVANFVNGISPYPMVDLVNSHSFIRVASD